MGKKMMNFKNEVASFEYTDIMSIFNEKMMNELEKKPTPIEKSIKKIVEDTKCDTQAFVSKDNAKNIIASEISELADIIDVSYLDNYDSWTKIVWSLKAIDAKNKEIAMQISEVKQV